MGQYEFSKGVMEKILRRAFLDGVIELYENCPTGRIYSVALEGDLSLTVNKLETFDIRLCEIAQRAPEKNLKNKVIKTETPSRETTPKIEDIKPKIKCENHAVVSSIDKTSSGLKSEIQMTNVEDNNNVPVECVSNINVPKTVTVKAETVITSDMDCNSEPVSKDKVLIGGDSVSESLGVSGAEQVSRNDTENGDDVLSRTEIVNTDETVSNNKLVSGTVSKCETLSRGKPVDRAVTSDTSQPVPHDMSVMLYDHKSSVVDLKSCEKPVILFDDVENEGGERSVTDDRTENINKIECITSRLPCSEDSSVSNQTGATSSKECETILIDDEDEALSKTGPEINPVSKFKRRKKEPRHSFEKRAVGQLVSEYGLVSPLAADFCSACPLCSLLFQNKEFFITHVESHRQQLGQTCLICSQGNLQTDGYLYHLATHHGTSLIQAAAELSGLSQEGLGSPASQFPVIKSEGEFRCLQCGRDFLTIGMLESHAESHRLEELESEKETVRAEFVESKDVVSYGCELCTDVFTQPSSLAEHHKQEHGLQLKGQMSVYVNDHTDDSSSEDVAVAASSRNLELFTCHRCGRSFRSWRSLKYHYLTTHGLQFTCEVCRNAFSSQRHLRVHEETHISTLADPVFKCNICDKTFPTVTHCTAHKRSHTSAKPHTCDLCGSCFFKRGDLTKHVRTVHCPKKHFVCKICGRTGTRSDNMRVHVKLHQKFMSRDQVDQLIEEVYNK